MTFRHLYNHVCDKIDANIAASSAPVLVEDVREFILTSKEVEELRVDGVDLLKTLGHVVITDERSSPYDEAEYHALVRFKRELNNCWTRFVTCKEMMHVYDEPEERTADRNLFYKLVREIQARPMGEDVSPLFKSEFKAEWMALTLLCPKPLQQGFKRQLGDDEISYRDVALQLRIPERIIPAIMDDYYDEALERFLRSPPALELIETA